MPKKVAVVIPCLNEARSIVAVLEKMPVKELAHDELELEVLVIDNGSTDDTAELARRAGAQVVHEAAPGKGNALRTGFRNLPDDADYVVMLDGDDTYDPREMPRLLEPLTSGFCSVVIGSRLQGKIIDDSMHQFHRLGNWVYTHLVRLSYRVNVTDVLTGYFAWTRPALDDLAPELRSSGFAIEMEAITKLARLGYDIYSVPISYHPRRGESSLRPLLDGFRILRMYLRNLRWRPSRSRAPASPR
ncbi:MAG TPA: glycosyltransferase family 2 protein [Acidimicrobiales bacterium]|nr:glycosyltransferase family 2 protein [Acidimicrobiales bacterium]